MKSILDALVKANEQVAGLRETLVKARDVLLKQVQQYPDLADALNPQIADLDAKLAALNTPISPEGLVELGATIFGELRHFKYTPTPHAGSGI